MAWAPAAWTRLERRELISVGLLVALGALLLGRHLGSTSAEFDEGVYVGSANLLVHGLQLGRDVFSSQPPLFLAFLGGVDRVAGGSLTALHGISVAIALAGALAGWALVRGVAGPFPALVALTMVVLAPGVVDAAAVVSADVPSVALGTAALLAARMARVRPAWAIAAGALIACALLVKLLAVPFAVALAVTAILDRPPRRTVLYFAAGAAAVLCAVAIAYASVLGDLWRQAVGLHLRASHSTVVLPRASIAGQVVLNVTAYLGMLAILALGLRHVPRAQLRGWAIARLDLLLTLAAGVLLISVNRPLLHHHLVVVAWPIALIAASTLPPRLPPRTMAAVAACGLLLVPWAVHGRDTVRGTQSETMKMVAAAVREHTAPDQTVVSDLPLVPLLAQRDAAAATVDPSAVRIGTGSLNSGEILAAADSSGAAVVGRSFTLLPGLCRQLKRRYGTVFIVDGIRIYVHASPGDAVTASRGGSRRPSA